MKLKIIFFCLSLFYSINIIAITDQQLLQLKQRFIPHAQVGVIFLDASTGKWLYKYHSNQRFNPASNVKLIIAASSLLYLGKNYHFTTTIATDKKQQNIIHNLYLQFNGNPSLTKLQLKQLLKQLSIQHIQQVTGNIYLDGSRFKSPDYASGWTQDDIKWYYSAPITAISIDRNNTYLTLKHTRRAGDLLIAESKYIKILSDNIKATKNFNNCIFMLNMNQKNQIHLSGCWPLHKVDSVLKIAIKNPELFVSNIIVRFLQQQDIKFNGKIILQKINLQHKIIISQQNSVNLAILVKHMLKHSDNFYAESLLKNLGYEYYKTGSFTKGILAEQKILAKHGFYLANNTVYDASGQSYYDLLTPHDLVKLLYVVYHSAIYQTIYQDLPISGIDGTLHYRLTKYKNIVHAKTGSMKIGNIALSGYAKISNKKTIIFAILINHAENLHQAKKFADILLSKMI